MPSATSANAVGITSTRRGLSSIAAWARDGRQAAAAYAESLLLADLLMRRAGTRMGIVLQGLDRGQTLEESLALIGVQLSDLEADVTKPAR